MLKVIELFAGIGSQTQALKNIGVEHEVIGISEIDKFCLESYKALHGNTENFGNICDIKELPKADLWTYSFPCQDISIAGHLQGINVGTRSGLLFQVERLLNIANDQNTLPKYLLLENVKNLVSKRFKSDFNRWLEFLENLGYKNYWQILNAKDYGIPQNRERVFCVSIRGEHSPFYFPKPIDLKFKLKDFLEENVDERYFLSDRMIQGMTKTNFGSYKLENKLIDKNDIARCIIARFEGTPQCVLDKTKDYLLKEKLCDKMLQEGKVEEGDVINHNYSAHHMNNPLIANQENKDCSPTLTTRPDTLGVVVKANAIPIKNATKKGYLLAEEGDGVDISGRMEYHRGTVQKEKVQTIKTTPDIGVVINKNSNLRIRKLTPRECLRLMGWKDEQIDKIQSAGISRAQQYKQAGNGIVVQVLEAIFNNLFKGEK